MKLLFDQPVGRNKRSALRRSASNTLAQAALCRDLARRVKRLSRRRAATGCGAMRYAYCTLRAAAFGRDDAACLEIY